MARYAAVLTASAWDPFVASQFTRTASHVTSGDLFVLANETQGPLAIPDRYRSLAVDESKIRALGLQIHYDQTLFCYNVDYLFIYFFLNNPGYDYYVFFDYPALIETDVDAIVDRARRDSVDFIAEPIAGPIDEWVYAKIHGTLYPPGVLRGVQLPIAILSAPALAHLARRRLELSRQDETQKVWPWPFCEAFVPTELALAGFKATPLSAYGSVEHYQWWPPALDGTLPADRTPGFIHPVLDRPRYVRSTLRHTGLRDLFRYRSSARTLRHVPWREYAGPFLAAVTAKAGQALRSRLPGQWRRPSLWDGAA